MRLVRRILLWLAILFVGFYLITRPEEAADAVRTVFIALAGAFRAIITFFTSLASS